MTALMGGDGTMEQQTEKDFRFERWYEPQKLDKKRIKRLQRSEFCIAQDSGRLVLI